MAQEQNTTPGGQKDDPRQAIEEGDPKVSGRMRGRPVDEQDAGFAGRTDPDASQKQGKKDVASPTPHRESGDRA